MVRRFARWLVPVATTVVLLGSPGPAAAASPSVDPLNVHCSADLFIERPVAHGVSPSVVFEEVNWSVDGITGHDFAPNSSVTVGAATTVVADTSSGPVTLGSSSASTTTTTNSTGGFTVSLSGGFGSRAEAPGTTDTATSTVTVKDSAGNTLLTRSGSGTCVST